MIFNLLKLLAISTVWILKQSYLKIMSISKCSLLSPDRFLFSTSFFNETRRFTAAQEGRLGKLFHKQLPERRISEKCSNRFTLVLVSLL